MTLLGKKRSVIRDIFEYANKRRAQIGAENVFDFSLGNPNVPAPADVNAAIRELLDTEDDAALHGYTSAQGAAPVRKAIADDLNRRFGTAFHADNLYMTCGAAASLKIILTALSSEGDEVIVFTPFFPEYSVFVTTAGMKLVQVPSDEVHSLMDLIHDDYPYISDPMPNLYFTRDPGACVGEGINIHHMHTDARRRESLILRYIYRYSRDFAKEGDQQWYDLDDNFSIEGGDVLVLSKDMVAVGLSQRTTISGCENFARNLLKNSDFKKVLAFDIPKSSPEHSCILIQYSP